MTSTSSRTHKAERGVTLVEVMLAASILALTVLAVFEGIAVSARIARENAEYLQADAYAFDLAWKRYNESYLALRNLVMVPEKMKSEDGLEHVVSNNTVTIIERVSADAVPMLYKRGKPVFSITSMKRIIDSDNSTELGLLISVDVEWGGAEDKRRLSTTHTATVFKSGSEDG